MKRFFNDVVKYYSYAVRSAKSNLKTEVANSYLNWIWWILDPLFNMIIYYLIFGVVFKSKEPHFTAFIFIGLTMWDFFNKNVIQSVNMIKRNKSIVTKVYIPKFILLISNMMVNGFKMLISWVIVVIMMIFSGVHISWNALWFFPIMCLLVLVTFALSVNLMHFGVFVEDLSNVMNIVLKLLFYVTGIFYNIEVRIGAESVIAGKLVTYMNPIAMLLRDMRNVLLYQKWVSWKGMLLWTAVSLVVAVIGVRTIYKNENSYVKVI
jgi:ABC-type polysaccharide/polyol phosphate export permease